MLTGLRDLQRELKECCGVGQVNKQWFLQDGAPPHTAKTTIEWLGEHLPGRVVGRGADVAAPFIPRSHTFAFLSVGVRQGDVDTKQS